MVLQENAEKEKKRKQNKKNIIFSIKKKIFCARARYLPHFVPKTRRKVRGRAGILEHFPFNFSSFSFFSKITSTKATSPIKFLSRNLWKEGHQVAKKEASKTNFICTIERSVFVVCWPHLNRKERSYKGGEGRKKGKNKETSK